MNRMVTVPAGYVVNLLQQAHEQGLDTAQLLSNAGISPTELSTQQEFSAERFSTLYQQIIVSAQDEYFGLLSGGQVPNGTFRMLCHAIIHCKTLEKALYRASAFHEICRGAQIKPRLVRKGRYAKIAFAPTEHAEVDVSALLQSASPARIRTTLSMWHHFVCWLLGTRLVLKAAYFTFPEPEDVTTYRTLFCPELRFNQHDNVLIFPARYLDYPLIQTEQSLQRFLKTAPFQLITPLDGGPALKAQVIALIGTDFSRELPGADEIAAALNLSVSTLRRRLLDEHTSYQTIKDECRRNAALHYIGSPHLSINEVAELMGCYDPSAFFRSFKRWTGMTPGEYRRQLGTQQPISI